MGRPAKIDLTELSKYKHEGKTRAQMARKFGVSGQAIKMALAKLADKTPTAVLVETRRVEQAADNALDAMSEMLRIRNEANDILSSCKESAPDIALQAIARLQKGLDQFLKMSELLHDWRDQQVFQEEVLAVIAEVDPGAREEIARRLQHRRSLRISVKPD